jgi:hypothetical protein
VPSWKSVEMNFWMNRTCASSGAGWMDCPCSTSGSLISAGMSITAGVVTPPEWPPWSCQADAPDSSSRSRYPTPRHACRATNPDGTRTSRLLLDRLIERKLRQDIVDVRPREVVQDEALRRGESEGRGRRDRVEAQGLGEGTILQHRSLEAREQQEAGLGLLRLQSDRGRCAQVGVDQDPLPFERDRIQGIASGVLHLHVRLDEAGRERRTHGDDAQQVGQLVVGSVPPFEVLRGHRRQDLVRLRHLGLRRTRSPAGQPEREEVAGLHAVRDGLDAAGCLQLQPQRVADGHADPA